MPECISEVYYQRSLVDVSLHKHQHRMINGDIKTSLVVSKTVRIIRRLRSEELGNRFRQSLTHLKVLLLVPKHAKGKITPNTSVSHSVIQHVTIL